MLSVRDAVAAFDSLAGQYVEQMVRLVPLTKARKNKLENKRFQNLRVVAEELKIASRAIRQFNAVCHV